MLAETSKFKMTEYFLVPLAGFEPATQGLGSLCSVLLSYRGKRLF